MADAKMPEKLGRYEVIRELGKGAMGIVYEGKDPNIGRRVAIKTARREVVEASGMADEMMERFLREAQAAGALSHPNIITIYDAAEENGIAYIAMEYLEGGDLGDLIEAKRKMGMEEIVEIGANICEALAVAHDSGVVHRDIKPANILMPTGQPLKVADFGIAHVSDSNLTQDGALIGTPHYMSPEQFMGQKLDGRSDLFSVGNILYELTTGEKPFSGEALSTVMHHVIKSDPVKPTELNFNVPDALSDVIMKALNKRPAQRYKNGNDMAAALRESLKENPNPAVLDPSKALVLEATITGAPPEPSIADQGTVLGDAPPNEDLISTQAGARPSSQETTIAEGPGATMPGGAPAPGATAPGGPPSPAQKDMGATAPGGGPSAAAAGTPAGSSSGPPKGLIIGGGIAAALIAIVGAVMVSGGGEEPAGSTSAGNSASNAPPPVSETAAKTPDAYYSMLTFYYLRAKTMNDYEKYEKKEVDRDYMNGKVEDILGPFEVTLLDSEGAVVKSFTYSDSGDYVELTPSEGAQIAEARAEIPSLTSPGETRTRITKITPAETAGAYFEVDVIAQPSSS